MVSDGPPMDPWFAVSESVCRQSFRPGAMWQKKPAQARVARRGKIKGPGKFILPVASLSQQGPASFFGTIFQQHH